ncbi:MAG: 23S rRNA (guanosine(2251)-2'-O)-methyltransferase RlmB, partial [Candidatus Kariarchaeum pelagius]
MEKNTEIYGIRAVIEAINSSKDIDKVFIQTGLKGKLIGQLESLIRKNKINFSYVPTQKLDRLSKKNHQGVIARIAPIKFYTIDNFSEVLEKSNNPFVLILDQINDVRNFGAIIRTAEISGVDGIIIQNSSSAPVNSDTIKTSAGAIFNIPICKVNHIKDAIYHLQSMNISIISASEKSEKNIYDVDLKVPIAIIMGSEQKGINKSVINLSNESVKLPMYGKIESLNVSVACGIFL